MICEFFKEKKPRNILEICYHKNFGLLQNYVCLIIKLWKGDTDFISCFHEYF